MSVNLTQPQLMLHHMAVEFAEKEIKPFDMAIDKKGDFTEGLFEKLVETGFLGLTLPEEYGGAGFDPISTAQVIYDLATANASVAVTLEGHYKTIDQFVNFGTPALKEKYLPSGSKRIFAFGMTESTGGSNPMGIGATAVKHDDHWILNGNKIMITNGGLAEVYAVLVKTAPEELSVFVVDKDMPGFKFGKRESFLGLRGTPVAEIFMENIVVSEDHLLGKLGEGHLIGERAHDDARILMGAVLAGILEHELEIATTYAKQRLAIDKPIIQLQAIQRKIADIAIAKENTTLLYQEAARLKFERKPYGKVAAMAKAYGSRSAVAAGDDALQVLGGYGYSLEYPIEHLIRDARALEIAEGTVEKMRTEIALAEAAAR
ncbi:acyl-CoA dehydrogenase family protein [Enterococcus sp. JM9B]|uniref:acyl-CoA dehydrogenase family protein n=1 Tax=Enterococcus sp. JM9B TaxID=1857216 RepID=UPI001374B547|nr:acyl-CoA dehydrogenase family protein [Enterococcus sp. JM9B]KAF1299985.1 acyl-CoA dehydrogenase [Enterococcus sp. JM9B]